MSLNKADKERKVRVYGVRDEYKCHIWKTKKTTIVLKGVVMKGKYHQFSSVTQSCLTLWDLMNCSTPGLPVHHQLPEFTQTHVHRVSGPIQPSHPRLSPSPPAPNPSLQAMAKVLEFHACPWNVTFATVKFKLKWEIMAFSLICFFLAFACQLVELYLFLKFSKAIFFHQG